MIAQWRIIAPILQRRAEDHKGHIRLQPQHLPRLHPLTILLCKVAQLSFCILLYLSQGKGAVGVGELLLRP